MLRTTKILVPSIVLSLTILGLAVIYKGGCMAFQFGADNSLRLESVNPSCREPIR
jgi:hypothetical protein